MKRLSITRNGLELAQAGLNRRLVTIGRSPSCDIVLRAPGVQPVQFLLERLGADWLIFDVSTTADAQTGEGVVLSADGAEFKGFRFSWVDSLLATSDRIGGVIEEQLKASSDAHPASTQAGLPEPELEIVAMRSDTGAIEQVLHLRPGLWRHTRRALKAHPEFRVKWENDKTAGRRIAILLEEMPEAKIFSRGQPVTSDKRVMLGKDELLEVNWKGHSFFLRFVPPPLALPKRRAPKREPALVGVWLVSLALSLLGLVSWLNGSRDQAQKAPMPELRIARLELPAPESAVAPPPPVVQPETPPMAEKQPPAPARPSAGDANPNPAKAVAPKIASPKKAPRTGLNEPAKVKDVNSVGLLGALAKAPPGKKLEGISPELLLQTQVNSDVIEGKSSKTPLTRRAQGLVGMSREASDPSAEKSQLAGASTTLQGGPRADSTSQGAIASAGARAGSTAGSLLEGAGSGASGNNTVGSLDTSGFEASGGLERETVRRVIAGHRAEIRTCYDRALLATPKLSGRISYSWLISASGTVTQATTRKDEIASPVLESCVREVILAMRFPKALNGRDTRVIYPFVFQAKSS